MATDPERPEPSPLDRSVDALRRAGAKPGDSLVVALSGGADSVALLLLLEEASRSGLPLLLSAAHLHHGLRGAEADADLEFVRALAAERGIPLIHRRVDVGSASRADHVGIEEAGRRARYGFLRSAARELGASFVATGHTLDDQAETVLFRLRRGAGLRGLAGVLPHYPLDPERGILVVRPLLAVARRELLALLRARGMAWREDSSNADPRFARNRIRLELLPLLRRDAPGIERSLASLADAAWALRRGTAGQDPPEPEEGPPAGAKGVFLSREEYFGGGPDFSRSLRRAYSRSGGIPQRLRRPHFRILEGMLKGNGPARIDLPGSIAAAAVDGGVRFGGRPEEPMEGIPPRELPVPGSLRCGSHEISVRAASPAERDGALRERGRGPEYVDGLAIRPPLRVRSRLPGDRFHPLGAPGRKRLKEHLRAMGVPSGERDGRPIVTDGTGRIVWVAGGGIAHWARITPGTVEAIRFDWTVS